MQGFLIFCRKYILRGGIVDMKINPTKQKVVDAAASLFFQKGFHGTSVRDIAENASVNVSLISYYFNSKQGLLEYAVTNYYEMYLKFLEEQLADHEDLHHVEKLKTVIYAIIQYKTDYFQLTSFINRELSLDSTFVREMTVTYLAKENHLLSELFFPIFKKENKKYRFYYFMQLKGMLASPYMLKNEWSNQLVDKQAMNHFIDKYSHTISEWVDFVASKSS